jgi:hypothetical protein
MSKGDIILFAVTLCIAILIIGLVVALGNNTSNSNVNTPTPTPQPVLNVKVTSFNYPAHVGPVGPNLWYIFS